MEIFKELLSVIMAWWFSKEEKSFLFGDAN